MIPQRPGLMAAALLAAFPWAAHAASQESQTPPTTLSEDFEATERELPMDWRPITFDSVDRRTTYEIIRKGERTCLQARADRSASGVVWERDFDPRRLPVVQWEWMISGVLADGDIRTEAGDDLPARVVVMFPFDPEQAGFWEELKFQAYKTVYGEYPPARVLSYVWANKLPPGEHVFSAYTERMRHFALRSGEALAGTWQAERRHILEDFRTAFPEQPLPRKAQIGIMVDADNTGATATACFDALRVKPAPQQTAGDDAAPAATPGG